MSDAKVIGAIYVLSDPRNPSVPKYVGLTKNPIRQRLYEHLVRSYTQPDHPLSIWLRELDAENIIPTITVLERAEIEQLSKRETAWIRFYRPLGSLLNISDGPGMLGQKGVVSALNRQATAARNRKGLSPEIREKIRQALSKPWSEERKKKFKERPGFDEWRAKTIHRNKNADRSKWKKGVRSTWSKTPEITLLKRKTNPVLIAHEQRLKSFNETRKKPIICVETGKEFESTKEASRQLGVHCNAIKQAIKNGWKCKEFHWKYKGKEANAVN